MLPPEGDRKVGRNFRRLLEMHPVYVDANSSLAGAYMTNFGSYRTSGWNRDLPYDHLAADHERYRLYHGIGGGQHFCQDMTIGFSLGRRRACFASLSEEMRTFVVDRIVTEG